MARSLVPPLSRARVSRSGGAEITTSPNLAPHSRPQDAFQFFHLALRSTQRLRAARPLVRESLAQLWILHELPQRVGQHAAVGSNQDSASAVDYLQGTAHRRANNRQSGVEGFYETDAERLGCQVWLAEYVGGGQQSWNVAPLTQEPDAISNPEATGRFLQCGHVFCFSWALRAADDPSNPIKLAGQFRYCLQMKGMSFPCLHSAYLDNNDCFLRRLQFTANRKMLLQTDLRGRRHRVIENPG